MSSSPAPFRWRTIIEFAAIASVIYFFLGAPGLSDVPSSGKKDVVAAPKVHIRPESLVYPEPDLECPDHKYGVHVFSTKPLVIYIDGFLSSEEADALIELR